MPPRLFLVILFLTIGAFAAQGHGAALSATPLPTASPALPSAATIFRHHHESLGKLPTLVARWAGSITENGQTARYEVIATRDGRYHRTYILAMTRRSEGSNGTLDWEQDENGNVRTAPAQHHAPMDARLVRLNDITFDPGSSVVLAASDLNGRRVYSVSMPLQGKSAIVYFDAATWLVDGADFGSDTVRYLAYRRFEGVAVPVDIAETGTDEALEITVDSVSFLPMPTAGFDPPVQREPLLPTGAQRVELNFDSPRGLISCAVKVNDHPSRFLIDSGSTTSIIDLNAAKRFGLPQGGRSSVEGAATFTGTIAKIDSLELGGIRFEPLYVQAIPLRLPERISHEGIDGILGYDLFSALVVRVSYQRAQIELTLPGTFTYGGTGAVIPADVARHFPVIAASIGKEHPGSFSVDTGSTAQLVLYKHFADANNADFLNPTQHDIGIFREFIYDPEDFGSSTASGAGGDFPTRHVVLDRLNLGSFSLPDVPTEIVLHEQGAFAEKSSTDGIIGGGALAMFAAVFFDYAGGRVILEK